jgi:DNA-binding transcriptional MerR regulator
MFTPSLAFNRAKLQCGSSSRLEVKRVKDIDIAEVAQRAGVPASTLRFYEEKGLIAAIGRRGLRRVFDSGVLERLALIALWRGAGFSLDEIALMFAPDGQPRIDRQMLAAKADELDQTIRQLSAMRDSLRHAAPALHPAIWNVLLSAACCRRPHPGRLDRDARRLCGRCVIDPAGQGPPYGSVNLRLERNGQSEVKRAPPTKR